MEPIPKTSKAAVLERFGTELVIKDIAIPELEKNAILVKVEIAGICGSDVHVRNGDLSSKRAPPFIPGHEVIGRVVALGEGRTKDVNESPLAVGDRIMWEQTSCGRCYWCEVEHQPIMCQNREYYGFFPPSALRGGFSEYEYIAPATQVIKVPVELTNEEAVGVACAFRTVAAGYEKIRTIGFQDNVVIQGAGPVGLYATVVARESNAGSVIVVGGPHDRLELAKRWGADHVINIDEVKDPDMRRRKMLDLTNGRGPEFVIECSGFAPAFKEGLEMIKQGGTYLILGATSKAEVTIAPSIILMKKITIVGSQSATIRHYHKALQFICKHRNKYPFDALVTGRYPLEQINEALENMQTGKEIKPVIDNTPGVRSVRRGM